MPSPASRAGVFRRRRKRRRLRAEAAAAQLAALFVLGLTVAVFFDPAATLRSEAGDLPAPDSFEGCFVPAGQAAVSFSLPDPHEQCGLLLRAQAERWAGGPEDRAAAAQLRALDDRAVAVDS